MKPQPFFARVKKILFYPFNKDLISRQKRALAYLDELCELYVKAQNENFSAKNSVAYQEIVDLRNNLNECWDLHDVTLLITKQINTVLWGKNRINIKIFHLKTKWLLWDNIFLGASLIKDEGAREDAKHQFKLLQELSSIFDLGN